MRKVIDTNALQSRELHAYLAAGQRNMAVLTDFTAIESHKGNTLKSVFASMAVLAQFPAQVLILKSSATLCGIDGRARGLQRRLIDERASSDFERYCRQLARARAGDAALQAQILKRGQEADAISERILTGVSEVTTWRRRLAAEYSASEIRIIRTGATMPYELGVKFVRNVCLLATFMLRQHPRVRKMPAADTVANRYIFRYALCVHFWLLDWIERGSNDAKPERTRNDLVDLHFATSATYFDGLISSDALTQRIYLRAAEQLAFLLS